MEPGSSGRPDGPGSSAGEMLDFEGTFKKLAETFKSISGRFDTSGSGEAEDLDSLRGELGLASLLLGIVGGLGVFFLLPFEPKKMNGTNDIQFQKMSKLGTDLILEEYDTPRKFAVVVKKLGRAT